MQHTAAVNRYVRALLQLIPDAEQETTAETLLQGVSALERADAMKVLCHPSVPGQTKEKIIAGLGMNKVLAAFLTLLVRNGRPSQLRAAAEAFLQAVQEKQNKLVVEARTAIGLSEESSEELRQFVRDVTKKSAIIHNQVDPTILGGVVLRWQGTEIDGSLRGKMRKMQQSLCN